jgi:hypothetical protein
MTFVGFKTPRQKNEAHLEWLRSLPCCVCGNEIQTEAAHIRAGEIFYGKRTTGKSEKPSDIWALPLCGPHHREQHKGEEMTFWASHCINPFVLALSLAGCSGDHAMAMRVLERHRAIKPL